MRTVISDSEAWRKMVLRSMSPAAWLVQDAPDNDVAVSSRVRFARNLRDFRYPHTADSEALREVQTLVRDTINAEFPQLNEVTRITPAERDYLLGCRLISLDFPVNQIGRSVWLDERRRLSIMVNEEDHLRVQAVTAGWSLGSAERLAYATTKGLQDQLAMQRSEPFGYLTASPFNCGSGRRRSTLFHLIGLQHEGKLVGVIKALEAQGLHARGLFGESSQRVAGFLQVSATSGTEAEYVGACRFVMDRERQSRREVTRLTLQKIATEVRDYAFLTKNLEMAEALRILAWVRWAGVVGLDGFPSRFREVDAWISSLELLGTTDTQAAARQRADFLRNCLEQRG